MSNSFERYADSMLSARRRASKPRVVEDENNAPLVPTALEKEQRDNTIQFQRYKRAVKADSLALLNSEHGKDYAQLLSVLRGMTMQSTALLNYMRNAEWITRCNDNQKFTVLAIIDMAIIRMRVKAGLPPFSDPIPMLDQPDNVFLTIRKLMGVV